MSFVLQPMVAGAEIAADQNAPGSRRPVVDTTANGLPLVQITTPSAAGVSRNQYNRFNVDPQGAILNNSPEVVKTQQAGYVTGNPYLANGSAKVILNEVTSSNPSYLRGYTEVAGQRAEVVVANPNGIVCNGGGFINTSRGVLTTGTPVFGGAGSLDAFRVVGGSISIEGLGLDAGNIDQVDLVARSVKVNSELWAKRLNVVTGANQVRYADLGLQTMQGDNSKPLVGIDVAALGGMYANKILLVGTEAGVGVVSAGNIAAQAGDLTIDNQGRITLAGNTNATGRLDLSGKAGIFNSGTIYSGQDARISSQLLVENSGTLAAGSDVSIEAANLDSSGVLAAGVQADDGAVAGGDLTVSATGELKSTGQALAGNRMTLTGSSLELANSQTSANGDIVLAATAGDIDHTGGILQSYDAVSLSAAGAIKNDNGAISGAGNLTVQSSGAISNQRGLIRTDADLNASTVAALTNVGGHIGAAGDIDLTVANLDNTNGRIGNLQDSGGNLSVLSGGKVTNTGGEIASDQDLSMTADTLSGEGAVISGRDASLRLHGDYTQTAANLITANRDLDFSITGNLTNTGVLQASGNLAVDAASITNQGELGAGERLSAKTTTLRNTGSIVGGDIVITASQKIENVGPAAFIGASNAFGKLELLAPIIENRDETTAIDITALTTIYGLGQVVLAGGKDADSGQYANAGRVINSSGLIQSGGDMAIHADTLTNTRRTLIMGSNFTQVGQSSGSAFWTPGNPNVPGGRYIEPPHGGTWNSHYVQTDYTETRYRNHLAAVSPEAQIISGGNLDPAVNLLQNYWSKVTAAGDISLNGVTLDQDSWRGATPYLERSVYNGTYLYQNYKGIYWRMDWPGPQTIDTPLPGYDASLTAHGDISGSGATIHNTAGSSNATPLGMQAGPVGQAPVLANFSLPQGGLFHTASEPRSKYLVETNPAFTNRTEWLSSDWYFQRMGMDPVKIQKRLGDGFYEQKLIRDEILSLTGKTVLAGYADEEAQFKEMMTAGAALVQDLDIRPGISLNAEQTAQLTSNAIIMETREVDGNSVLVPVVYLARISQNDLLPTGSMITAANINLSNTKAFANSGTIKAGNAMSLSGQAIDNRGGNLQSGGLMALNTTGDIDLTSASVKAGSLQLQTGSSLKLNTDAKTINDTVTGGARNSTMLGRVASLEVAGDARIETGGDLEQKGAQLKVGGDLAADIKGDWRIGTRQSRETTRVNQQGGHSFTDTVQNIGSVIQVGGQSNLKTGGDLVARGARIELAGDGSIQAGGNVELLAARNSFTLDSASSGSDFAASLKSHDETVVGTSLQSGKSLTVESGKDIRLAGSSLNVAQGSATLAAAGNVTIQAETEQHTSDWQHAGKHSGIVSTTTTAERDQLDSRVATDSALSADAVTIQSGNDIVVTGSSVVGTDDVALMAQNDIKIEAAANTRQESHFREKKKSGLLSSGGVGFTIGSRQHSTDAMGASAMAVASTVGSAQGKVAIEAGNDYRQVGSDVLAPQGDIDISAQKIDISEARNTSINTTETRFKQSGLTVALSNPLISAVQTVDQMQEAARRTKDPRMKALAAASSALAAKNAYDAVQAGQGQTVNGKKGQIVTGKDADGKLTSRDANAIDKVGGINVSLSVGSSKSRSNSTQTSSTAVGGSVAAGNNVTISATGAGKKSDLTVQGSRITAGNNVTLKADDTINLLAAQSTAEQHSTNTSSSGSIGVSFGSDGFMVNAAASKDRGHADGSDVTYSNTHVEAGNMLALQSGGDTALKGAVASGRRVVADVGGNLNVESLQDTSRYDSKQSSIGGSISVGYGMMSGSFNISKSNAVSNYASVVEQSGLKAGDEGFQVNVNGNTDLKGAVIAATDKAVDDGRNSLTTATLTTSDIQNHAAYSVNSSSMGAGLSYNLTKSLTQNVGNSLANTPGMLLPNLKEGGNQSGVSRSAIAQATVNITDTDKQQSLTGQSTAQTIAGLDRNTSSAHAGALEHMPDVEEIRQQQEASMQIISTAAPLLAQSINNIYDRRIADYNRQYDGKISAAKQKEAEAKELEANGNPDEARLLNDQAQTLRAQAIELRNERDTPKLSRGLAQALGTALIGGLASGQADLGQSAASYALGTAGDKFILVAQKRDHDKAQGIEVTCKGTPPECTQAASHVAGINDPKVPLEDRLKALEDTGQFAIKIVDGNSHHIANVASNGILNEPDRALVLAVGELRDGTKKKQTIYLSYNDTQGGVADLINAGIDKNFGAESNVSHSLAQAFADAGDRPVLYAHSGGTAVSDVALNELADSGYINPNIRIDFFGPAVTMRTSAQSALRIAGLADAPAEQQANWLKYGDVNGLGHEGQVNSPDSGMKYLNNPNDPVSTFVGFNFGQSNEYNNTDSANKLNGTNTGSIWQSVLELPALFATSTSAHSVYRWNNPATWPENQENTGADNKDTP